jgi:predicted nucleic acid-binding protein
MYNAIFFDANIILDIFDNTRKQHASSAKSYLYILEQGIHLSTSCDIITTLYYVYSKQNKQDALDYIEKVTQTLDVIAFSNEEVNTTCQLMREDKDYNDLEDTIQYILAQKMQCDLIISNDKKFISKEIEIMNSEAFCALI